MKFSGKLTTLACVIFVATLLTTTPRLASAENMRSDSYEIQFGNFNVTSGQKDSDSFSLTDTVGQVGAGPYGQYGSSSFFVGGGFQYIYQIPEFRFSISKLAVNLGQLTPGAHNTDSHTLTINTRGAGGYTIYAYEEHALRLPDGSVSINDTNCDSGCSISSSGLWIDTDNPGFGYNILGDDVPSDFIDINYFRPFANISLAQTMQPVMFSDNIAQNRQATVTYKAGLAGNQAEGRYETTVVYVAVPGY